MRPAYVPWITVLGGVMVFLDLLIDAGLIKAG